MIRRSAFSTAGVLECRTDGHTSSSWSRRKLLACMLILQGLEPCMPDIHCNCHGRMGPTPQPYGIRERFHHPDVYQPLYPTRIATPRTVVPHMARMGTLTTRGLTQKTASYHTTQRFASAAPAIIFGNSDIFSSGFRLGKLRIILHYGAHLQPCSTTPSSLPRRQPVRRPSQVS